MDLTRDDVIAARERIRAHVYRTPLERAPWLGEHVYLKLECWQRTRSFKVRGAFNALARLSAEDAARGVVTASAGNHGQGVALAAREFGFKATIFLPSNAPFAKKSKIAAFGAVLNEVAPDYDAAEILAREFAEKTGSVFVHGFSDPDVVAGQGTVGLEIVEDLPEVKNIVVPVGGGGLIAGVGVAIGEQVRIIGAQSEQTRAMYDAFEAGRVVDSPITPTLADGLAGATDEMGYARAREVTSQIKLVTEAATATAMKRAYLHGGIVLEGSGAVGLAAIDDLQLDGPTVIIASGGNIDAKKLASIIAAD